MMKRGRLWKSTRTPFGSLSGSFAGISIEGVPAAHNCAATVLSGGEIGLLIKDQRKGSQYPVSAIKSALTFGRGGRGGLMTLAFFNARASRAMGM
jgi:hypothetical protein